MARDALEALLEHDTGIGDRYLFSWASSGIPLLRRLAVHGWAERQDATADAKIDWLRDTGWLSDLLARHETMRLLVRALPDASQDTADKMVQHVLDGLSDNPAEGASIEQAMTAAEWNPRGADDRDRSVYDYLAWIADHRPGLESAKEALAAVQARYPHWERRDHPDFLIWTSSDSGSWLEPDELVDPDRLHELIERDPEQATRYLQSSRSDASSPGWADERWHNALGVLRDTAEEHPGDGLAMIDLLTDGGGTGDRDDDQWIADAVLGAWVNTEIGDALYEPIATRLSRIWETGTSRWTRGTGILGGGVGPLTHAINHWAGRTAQIALRLVSHEYQQPGTDRAGLSDRLKAAMETMISGVGTAAEYAQVILAGKVRLLFAADEQWCRDKILPLLDPQADQDRAVRCWDGYLHVGGAHPKLLEAGLLASYLKIAPIADRWDDASRRSFYMHLAAIALFTGINPIEHGWLDEFTAHADPDSRTRWIRAVRAELNSLSTSAADAQWDSWMHDYWDRRLWSIPQEMTATEASHLAEWAACLGDRFPQAVELATDYPAPISEFLPVTLGRTGDEANRTDHLVEHPEQAAQLLTHLLANIDKIPPPYESIMSAYLGEVVPVLLDRLDAEHADPLREQAARLRISPYSN